MDVSFANKRTFDKKSAFNRRIRYMAKTSSLLTMDQLSKAKCHLKNLPVEGHCGRCSLDFIDWRYSHVAICDPAL
jgi:hypothetical protein